MPRDHTRNSAERRLAAALFAVLILAAALLFGAVDRIVQLGLVFGLALGFLLHPPEVPRLPRIWAWLGLGFVGFVIVSQFLPSHWFGQTVWRAVLARDYEVAFPFTRNPEPGRAVDCILMGSLAAAWFFWVRTLAADPPVRFFLLWALFRDGGDGGHRLAVARHPHGFPHLRGPLLARLDRVRAVPESQPHRRPARHGGAGGARVHRAVSAAAALGATGGGHRARGGGGDGAARERNHAAACWGWGAARRCLRCWRSRSFAAAAPWRRRSRAGCSARRWCSPLARKLLDRFESPGDGNIPNNLRWQIWQDAIRVWRDAPLWGHGLGTFAQIFPLYQTVQPQEMVILHPESSWLLWLDELGAIPVAAGAALLLYFLAGNAIAAVRSGERGFFIRAGAFAGVFALLCHALWDVPAHRWGTAAFGIALLAIACPSLDRRSQIRLGRLWAAAPLLIGLFWLLPYLDDAPYWSPDGVHRLLTRLPYSPTTASLDDLRKIEGALPLNPELHEQIGIREIEVPYRSGQAWREFRIADRLLPSSWALPAMQGWLSRGVSPGISFHFWSLSIERSGRRAPEIFLAAYRNSVDLPGGEEYWQSYAQGRPEYLLCYAEAAANDAQGKAAYDQWWKARGDSSAGVDAWEPAAFYSTLRKWGDRAQLQIWMNRRPELEPSDYKTWAAILHEWQLDADAWRILSRRIKDPAFPESHAAETAQALEENWRAHPDDPVTAQAYARQCSLSGDSAKCEQVILSIATGKSPPPWFIEKAAFMYAAKKDYTTAVTSLLRLADS